MSSLFKTPKVPAPQAPVTPPDSSAADAERRRKEVEAAELSRRQRGRAATIMSSGSGVDEELPSARKTLTGY